MHQPNHALAAAHTPCVRFVTRPSLTSARIYATTSAMLTSKPDLRMACVKDLGDQSAFPFACGHAGPWPLAAVVRVPSLSPSLLACTPSPAACASLPSDSGDLGPIKPQAMTVRRAWRTAAALVVLFSCGVGLVCVLDAKQRVTTPAAQAVHYLFRTVRHLERAQRLGLVTQVRASTHTTSSTTVVLVCDLSWRANYYPIGHGAGLPSAPLSGPAGHLPLQTHCA